eukprot:superscaffoldBa00006938_g22052
MSENKPCHFRARDTSIVRQENFLTPAVFGEIIYDNFLFDIPKILDLCMLFGKGNSQLLHKMIENIFTQQPSYYSDLDETVPTVLEVFDTILDRCGLQCEGATAMEPMKLNAHKQPTAMTMSQQVRHTHQPHIHHMSH